MLLSALLLLAPATHAPQEHLGEVFVIGDVGTYRRSPVHTDAVERAFLAPDWAPPTDGAEVELPDGTTRAWQALEPAEDGTYSSDVLRNGYLYASYDSPREEVLLLDSGRCSMLYVNGVPRAGDLYGYGSVRTPVALRDGRNEILVRGSRSSKLHLRLAAPDKPIALTTADNILPDLLLGETEAVHGAVLVRNATREWARGLTLVADCNGITTRSVRSDSIPPLGVRMLPFRVRAGEAPGEPGSKAAVSLKLLRGWEQLDELGLELQVKDPSATHVRTFESDIDGSVQYFGVTPAHTKDGGVDGAGDGLALLLSLHGAGVGARGQAGSYSHKSWSHIVAPTNRRPFGFDWEDWGRMDALEVLAEAERLFGTDPRRTYLSGHSMGGHGTWNLGVHFPGRFAAIGPSAGWASFWSYSRGAELDEEDPVGALLRRASSPSDTLGLSDNYAQQAVYVLHGIDDGSVGVTEAEGMIARLEEFHRDFQVHLEPGAGHWWDHDKRAPGVDCLDWAPMFDLFARRRLPEPEALERLRFTTVNPAISADCHWARIAAQERSLAPSIIDLRQIVAARTFVGTTENVARLELDLAHLTPGQPIRVELDGDDLGDLDWPAAGARLWLAREDGAWRRTEAPPRAWKGPHRAGPFKEAFRNRILFVCGTQGSDEEDAWCLARARYDAETFWYRGAASVEVIRDVELDAALHAHRNVVLYGNADLNGAWSTVLAGAPVQVRNGRIEVGERVLEGDDLACLFTYPRDGSDETLVAVVAGTGHRGRRMTERMPYFVSGAAFPDWMVFGPEMLTGGAAGVRGAGFFGERWELDPEQSAWR
ncbi:MAG: prolyl oligopeptidase family serine peptidase [Planctomycetota bacterium]